MLKAEAKIMLKKLLMLPLAAILCLFTASAASAQATQAGITPCGTPVTLSVTTSSSNAQLSTCNGTVVVWNVGSNEAFFTTGTTSGTVATTSNYSLPAGTSIVLNFGTSGRYLAAITASSTTTLRAWSGLGMTALAGGSGSGGSGGAVTCALCALESTQQLVLSAVQGAIPAGTALIGKVGIDQTTPGTTNAVAPTAGELHLGEIGSNQIKVQVAQTVTASSAYTSGDAIGGLMTIAGAARVSGSLGAAGTGGILSGMVMNSKSLQTTQVDVVFFDANPTGSTCTNKTAFSLATADFDKVVGYLTIPGTAANGAGWVAGTVGSLGIPSYYPVTYDLASATSIYACAVTRGTPTWTATTDVSFKFNFLRN